MIDIKELALRNTTTLVLHKPALFFTYVEELVKIISNDTI